MYQLAIYVLDGIAYIPTTGRIVGGPWLQVDPVHTASVGDLDGLRKVILYTMEVGSPILQPPFPKYNPPVVVQAMKLKSWSALVRRTRGYFVSSRDQGYSIHFHRRAKPKDELATEIEIPDCANNNQSVADFLIERIRADEGTV